MRVEVGMFPGNRKDEVVAILKNTVAPKTDSNKEYLAFLHDRKIFIFWISVNRRWDFPYEYLRSKDEGGVRFICSFLHASRDDIPARVCDEILDYWEHEQDVSNRQRSLMYSSVSKDNEMKH